MSEPTSDGKRTAPRSVRDGLAPPTQMAPEVETPTRTLEVSGAQWLVAEAGRAEAGTTGTAVPLLLVTFQEVVGEGRASEDTGRTEKLEAMVVGRSLDSVAEEALQVALSRARPWRDPNEPRPFFADTYHPGGS